MKNEDIEKIQYEIHELLSDLEDILIQFEINNEQKIEEIILLGDNGAVTRIQLENGKIDLNKMYG